MNDKAPADDKGFDLANDPAFKQLQSIVTTLGRSMTTIADGQTALQDGMTRLTTDGLKVQAPPPALPPKASVEDLDEMSQSTLAGHIIDEVAKLVDGKVSSLDSKLNDTTASFSKTLNKDKLTAFVDEHPDIVDLTDEVKSAMTEYPTMTFDKAYSLVRAELPTDRREALDLKYATDVKEKKQPFGGLTPTSGDYTAEGTDDDLTADEAGDKAWADITEQFPDLAKVD
jgi:hypothetical protein